MDGSKLFALFSVVLMLSVGAIMVAPSEDADASVPEDTIYQIFTVGSDVDVSISPPQVGLNKWHGSVPGLNISFDSGPACIHVKGTPTTPGIYTVYVDSYTSTTFVILEKDGCNSHMMVGEPTFVTLAGKGVPSESDYTGSIPGMHFEIKQVNQFIRIPVLKGTPTVPGVYTISGFGQDNVFEVIDICAVNLHNGADFSEVDCVTGRSVVLPSADKPGMIFQGWYTAPDGGVRVGGAGDSYVVKSDVNLYAHLVPENVEITSSAPSDPVVVGNTFVYKVQTSVSSALSVSGPSWLSVSGNKIVGTPSVAGVYDVVLTASTGHVQDTQSFRITVIDRLTFESAPTGSILVSGA